MFRRLLMNCCVCFAGLFSASAGDWYSVEKLTDLAIVPVFAVNPEVYTADTSALSHEILLEYLQLKNYPTPKAAASSRKPRWMGTLLISDEKSALSSKEHLAAVARQHGDKFAAIYKAYVRSVEEESAPVGDSGLDDAALFRLMTLAVSRYQATLADRVCDSDVREMLRHHQRLLAVRLFVLSRVKRISLDTGMKEVVYKACAECTNKELTRLLGNRVNGSPDGPLGNGLPGNEDARLSRKEIQTMVTDWKNELDSLFAKGSEN
jgi:hypothetical protein